MLDTLGADGGCFLNSMVLDFMAPAKGKTTRNNPKSPGKHKVNRPDIPSGLENRDSDILQLSQEKPSHISDISMT